MKLSDYNLEKDIFLSIPSGRVPHSSSINKFGRNADVDATQEDIWDGGGTYSWPTTASITHVRSAVDSAATRGMTLEVQGLDANWDLVVQNATLNAVDSTTEVVLTTPLIRCFRIKNTSDTDNDQAIQAGPTGFGTINAQITIGYNQTLMALYTIPNGFTGFVVSVWGNDNRVVTTGAADITFWARSFGGVFRVQRTVGAQISGNTGFQHYFTPYAKYSSKTDLKMTGIGTSGTNHDISAGFDLILLEN